MAYRPTHVLDAGCGTGRVAVELAARGVEVVGFDLDESMLAVARSKAPELRWVAGDAATIDLRFEPGFDVVVLAGNVMIFVAPGTEAAVVANLAPHLRRGGRLVAGFSLRPGGYGLEQFDEHAVAAGLTVTERWSTWDREPWSATDGYAVTVLQAGE